MFQSHHLQILHPVNHFCLPKQEAVCLEEMVFESNQKAPSWLLQTYQQLPNLQQIFNKFCDYEKRMNNNIHNGTHTAAVAFPHAAKFLLSANVP